MLVCNRATQQRVSCTTLNCARPYRTRMLVNSLTKHPTGLSTESHPTAWTVQHVARAHDTSNAVTVSWQRDRPLTQGEDQTVREEGARCQRNSGTQE